MTKIDDLFNYASGPLAKKYADNKYALIAAGADAIGIELGRAPTYTKMTTFLQEIFEAGSAKNGGVIGSIKYLYSLCDELEDHAYDLGIMLIPRNVKMFTEKYPFYTLSIRVELKDNSLPLLVKYKLSTDDSAKNKEIYKVSIKDVLDWIDNAKY